MPPEAAELNIDTAADAIAAEMGFGADPATDLDATIDAAADTTKVEADDADKGAAKDEPAAETKDAKQAAEAELPMPASWAKEQKEIWDEMTPRARAQYVHREKQMLDGLEQYKGDAKYGRDLRSVLAKHEDVLKSQGIAAPQAIEFLFNAHRRLSSGTPEQRQAYLVGEVAKAYGITVQQAAAAVAANVDGTQAAQPAAIAPEVKAAMERVDRIEAALAAEQTQRYEAVRKETAAEVEAFASDPKNAYFDECADDIAVFVKAGMKLADAYDKAVYANPVTRQKELSRIQQETEKANAEKVKEAAVKAKRATSTNVKGRDTTRAPTGTRATVANMDEVLSEVHAEIKSRH